MHASEERVNFKQSCRDDDNEYSIKKSKKIL